MSLPDREHDALAWYEGRWMGVLVTVIAVVCAGLAVIRG